MTDAARTAHVVAPLIHALGEAFMLDPATRAAGRELGYRGWPFYLAGRAGVLGPAPPDVLTAVLAFFPPAFIREHWLAALDVGPLDRAVEAYRESCRRWGRAHLAGAPGLDRLCELAERLVAGATTAGRPLFAGWVGLTPPGEPPDVEGRAAQLMHVLREHRGGAHIIAVMSVGLRPLAAVLADPEAGVEGARYFRWPQPYELSPAERALRAKAEARTDALVGADLERLSPHERIELVELVTAAHAHALGPASAGSGSAAG